VNVVGERVTEPRRWWCNFDGYQLPGELSVPFKRVRCPNCRRLYSVRRDGEHALTIEVVEPKMAADKASDEVKSGRLGNPIPS
jgi:hypothetical protein